MTACSIVDEDSETVAKELLTDDVMAAQTEADLEVDRIESEALKEGHHQGEDEVLAPMPKLLELDQKTLVHKTRDFKARGDQLDLLLLKAESYSHFIRMNQVSLCILVGQIDLVV
jgi:hypothetical protein